MSEIEVPWDPDPYTEPPPKKPRAWKKFFAKRKWPGWGFLILLLFNGVPDLKSRFDFWVQAAYAAGGYVGTGAAVIGSPFFSIGLAAVGLAWLAFIGEPQKGAQRYHWLPYAGWAMFGLCATAMIITAGWGAIQIYVSKQIAVRGGPGWHLSDTQKMELIHQLELVPETDRFVVSVRCLIASTQSQSMAFDITETLKSAHWNANVMVDQRLIPDLEGINIVFNPDGMTRRDKDLPFHAYDMANILKSSDVSYSFGGDSTFPNNSVMLAIGSRSIEK